MPNLTLIAKENRQLSAKEGCPVAPQGLNFPETTVIPVGSVIGVGYHGMKLGHDCPCGESFHITRVAWRFDIAGVSASQVYLSIFRLINLDGELHPGVGTGVFEWVAHNAVLPIGDNDTTIYNAPVRWTAVETLTPATPEGRVLINVTQAFTQAKILGDTHFVIRARLTDESDQDCLNGTAWYSVGAMQAAALYQPILDLTPPVPIVVAIPAPISLTMVVIEPCVLLVGDKLATLPDLPSWDKGRGKGGIQVVRRGNVLQITVLIMDNATVPGLPFDPAAALMTLTAANDTVVVNAQPMTRVAKGVYRTTYRTQATDPLGLYRGAVEVMP